MVEVSRETTEEGMKLRDLGLPIGYYFIPTDTVMLENYLIPKIKSQELHSDFFVDFDVYQCDPQQIPSSKCKYVKENEGYYFIHMDGTKERGMQIRNTPGGYWQVSEEDRNVGIYDSMDCNRLIGFKDKLCFYQGEHPNGVKTDWKIVEYRCHPDTIGDGMDYIVCRVRYKEKVEETGSGNEDDGEKFCAVMNEFQ